MDYIIKMLRHKTKMLRDKMEKQFAKFKLLHTKIEMLFAKSLFQFTNISKQNAKHTMLNSKNRL